ncbi:MAG: hypothetical protein ACI91V_000882, partial [Lentimonas sp.]
FPDSCINLAKKASRSRIDIHCTDKSSIKAQYSAGYF